MSGTASKERATFSIAGDIKGRLEKAIPRNERSRFVEGAIDQALRKAEAASFRDFLNALPKAPTGGESSTDYLRRKRMEWDGRSVDVLEGRRR